MLLMFKVRNYASFKDESMLDMRATSYIQHPNHIYSASPKRNLLKTAAIFGANASGKSNFISAMFFFKQFILSQLIDMNDNLEKPGIRLGLKPFSLCRTPDKSSEFEIAFIQNGDEIQYGFECTREKIISEWLDINNKKVFERSEKSLTIGTDYRDELNPYKSIPDNRLYIGVLDYFLSEENHKIQKTYKTVKDYIKQSLIL